MILVDHLHESLRADDLRNRHNLLLIVKSGEEVRRVKEMTGERAAERPHVHGVRVRAKAEEQLGCLPIARAHVKGEALIRGEVVLAETPVTDPHLARVRVDERVQRLNVIVNDALRVSVRESLQLRKVEKANVDVLEGAKLRRKTREEEEEEEEEKE